MNGCVGLCRKYLVLLVAYLLTGFPSNAEEDQLSSDSISPIWGQSNAVLLLDLPISLCAPQLKARAEKGVQICLAEETLPAHTRVRLIDYWRGAGRLFIKVQHPVDGYISTLWLESAGPSSFAKDDDREMFLPELSPLPEFDSQIMGRWDVASWKLTYEEPQTTGQLVIDERLGPNSFAGVFHVVADLNYNQKGLHRFATAINRSLHKIDQPVTISVNGRVLTVESGMLRRVDAKRVHMLLSLDGKNLRGYAGQLKKRDKDWTDLPEIVFTKSE